MRLLLIKRNFIISFLLEKPKPMKHHTRLTEFNLFSARRLRLLFFLFFFVIFKYKSKHKWFHYHEKNICSKYWASIILFAFVFLVICEFSACSLWYFCLRNDNQWFLIVCYGLKYIPVNWLIFNVQLIKKLKKIVKSKQHLKIRKFVSSNFKATSLEGDMLHAYNLFW